MRSGSCSTLLLFLKKRGLAKLSARAGIDGQGKKKEGIKGERGVGRAYSEQKTWDDKSITRRETDARKRRVGGTHLSKFWLG